MPLILGITIHHSTVTKSALVSLVHVLSNLNTVSTHPIPLDVPHLPLYHWMELVPECRQGILQNLLHICSVFPLTPEPNDNICVLFEVFHICIYVEFCIILVSDVSNFPLLRSALFLWRELCRMTSVWHRHGLSGKVITLNQQNHCGNTPFC